MTQSHHRRYIFKILAASCLLLTACQALSSASADICQPLGYDAEALQSFKSGEFEITSEKRTEMTLALVNCLGDPDPNIRDGIAYEALTRWLRSGTIAEEGVRKLQQSLLAELKAKDSTGFAASFSALVLSEIARVDRVSPYLTDAERSAFIAEAIGHMMQITDYRGFNDLEGWRHDIAHTADWLMQFSLNEKVRQDDLVKIRGALTAQVAPSSGHVYIHGESERLARPVLFMAMRGGFTEEDWTTWFVNLVQPDPLEDWNAAFKSENGLAQLHNVKAFLNTIYVNASESSNEGVKTLLPGTVEALRKLP